VLSAILSCWRIKWEVCLQVSSQGNCTGACGLVGSAIATLLCGSAYMNAAHKLLYIKPIEAQSAVVQRLRVPIPGQDL
jgi:hypothetical protein